jgi:hypothetical protein
MKNKLTLIFVLCSFISFAQIDLESILEGGTGDAQTFLKGYVGPAAIGFGNGINGGWYTTAKTHKLFGFDVAVIANAAFVPSNAETFTFNNADYNNIKLDNSSLTSAELPTLFGSQALADRPLLEFSDSSGNKISSSTLPGSGLKEAINYNVVPSAMVQVGVGLFFNTDLKIRFVPKQTADEYEFSTFGIGIQHDLKQWIPFVKRLPFDVSALLAWNDVKSKAFLDADNEPSQALEFNTKTFLFQILASKKLSIFTLYGGIGTSSYDSDVNMLGTYKTSQNQTFTDPVALAYSGSSMRANLGLSMKLLFLNISADYALQEYDTFTISAGFSFR